MADIPEFDDSRVALRWYWAQGRVIWQRFVQLDSEIHESLYAKFPTTIEIGGTILRFIYNAIISPAFAVILALLLVGLVISGAVPIIVSVSVFSAWLIATLSVAKMEAVGRLRIISRILVVLVTAALLALVANKYVNWCLSSYYRNKPKEVAAAVQPSAITDQTNNTNDMLYQRLSQILEGEKRKHQTSGPQPSTPTAKEIADELTKDINKPNDTFKHDALILLEQIDSWNKELLSRETMMRSPMSRPGYVQWQIRTIGEDLQANWSPVKTKVQNIRDELAIRGFRDETLDSDLEALARTFPAMGGDKERSMGLPSQVADATKRMRYMLGQLPN